MTMRYLLFFLIIYASIPAMASSSGSIFNAAFSWRDDEGKNVQLNNLAEQQKNWTLISMMYTSCPSSCPMIVQKMRKLETALKEKGFKPEFVLVTFDPERDTLEKLKKHRKKIGVTETNWHFLNGSQADTRKLSMLLGIKYAKDPESGEFMHDNKIVLLSPRGDILARLNNLGESDSEIIETITKGGN